MFKQYTEKYGTDRAAMREICFELNLYWDDHVYDLIEKSSAVQMRLKTYFMRISNIKYIDLTYNDTLLIEAEKESNNGEMVVDGGIESAKPQRTVEQKVIDFWGTGFTQDFYDELGRRYAVWTQKQDVTSASEEALLKQICMLEVTIAKDTAQGHPNPQNVNMLNTLIGSMNLKPSQQKDELSATVENTPFGVWIRKWEDERPIPEPDPDLKDKDGLIRYISIWFLGHLCKMLGIKNSYCKLYEDEMAKHKIDKPEYAEEDDESAFNDIFGDDYE